MKKKTPPAAAGLVLLALLLPAGALHAQSTRESDRLLRRQTQREAAEPAPTPAEATPAEPVAPVDTTVVETPAPEPAPVEPAPAPEPVLVPVPVVDTAALEAEVARDPHSYRNDHYGFEVTEKGFIRRLALADGTVLVDSAGAVNLQGSYVSNDGRRVWFYAGGVGNSAYRAEVKKAVRDGAVVFDVEVTHPRFTMASTYVCGEKSVDVTVAFTPVNLQDQRGAIQGIYSVQLWPAALDASRPVDTTGSGRVAYPTKTGQLAITYPADQWRPGDDLSRRSLRIGDTGLSFNFDGTTDPQADVLRYTIALP
ncbi:MAG: hypothetical protein ABII82_11995 [Verrucomicrobiota bacterium]